MPTSIAAVALEAAAEAGALVGGPVASRPPRQPRQNVVLLLLRRPRPRAAHCVLAAGGGGGLGPQAAEQKQSM